MKIICSIQKPKHYAKKFSKTVIMRTPLLLIVLLFGCIAHGQNTHPAITAGESHYDHERYDSAFHYYETALREKKPSIRLQALAGLIQVAISRRRNTDVAPYIALGDSLLRATDDKYASCSYLTAKGEYLRSRSDFQEALKLQRRVSEKCRNAEGAGLLRAYALLYTAVNYEKMAQHENSFRYANEALALFENELDSTHVKFANIYNLIGNSYYRMSKFREAERFYRKAKRIAERAIGPTSDHLSVCLGNLANVARIRQDYEEAIQFSRQALAIKRIKGDTAGMSSDYYSLGIFHYFTGDYGRSRDYLEECIKIREKIYEPDHYKLSDPYEVMGILYEQAGDYPVTLHYFLKAQKIKGANFGENSIPVAYNRENVALLYQSLGRPDSALYYIRKASEVMTESLPTEHYALAGHYYSLADIYLDNELPEEALRALSKSTQIYRALNLEHVPEFALNLAGEARIRSQQQRWQEAGKLFDEALERLSTPDLPSPYRSDPVSLTVLDQYLQHLFSQYNRSRSPEVMEVFARTADDFLLTSNYFRKQFNDPYTRSLIAKGNTRVYRSIVGVFARNYLETGAEQRLEQVYRFAENSRTSSLRDQLDERIKSYAGIPDSLLRRERKWKEEINRLDEQLMEFPDSSGLRSQLLKAEARFDAHVNALTDTYPKYYELRYSSRILPLNSVKDRIEASQNIIQYTEDDSTYYALVLNRNRAAIVPIGERAVVNRLVQRYRASLQSIDFKVFDKVSRSLHRLLWAPLEQHLDGDQAVIIPVNSLFYVNFENLTPAEDRYLIQDYSISYALSVYDLFSPTLRSKHSAEQRLTISPGFEDSIKQAYLKRLDSLSVPDETYLKTVRQPWSLRLSRSLRKQYGFQAYTGTEASEKKIRDILHHGQILNFATHAFSNSLDPLRSKIVLAKDPSSREEDGYLHTFEIYGLDLNADLTVLGACESGIGDIRDGEGMISLAYGIKYAGSPNTVMTLWKVDEKVNTSLIERFYEQLASGQSIQQALRRAKLDHLESAEPPLSHPFFWSGLIFNGQDAQVPLGRRAFSGWRYPAGALLLILIFFVARFLRS